MSDYTGLTREQLVQRLRLAEAVCVMHGWSPVRKERFDREKALTMLWRRWLDHVGADFLAPAAHHPDLTDEHIAELARQRDETQAAARRQLDQLVVVEPTGGGTGA